MERKPYFDKINNIRKYIDEYDVAVNEIYESYVDSDNHITKYIKNINEEQISLSIYIDDQIDDLCEVIYIPYLCSYKIGRYSSQLSDFVEQSEYNTEDEVFPFFKTDKLFLLGALTKLEEEIKNREFLPGPEDDNYDYLSIYPYDPNRRAHSCSTFVSGHNRRSYTRKDGTYVKSSKVKSHFRK